VDTRSLGGLTVAEQVDNASQAVDIAQGLGRHVTVLGISAGGTLVSWLAQYRQDVDAAVAIAPLFGILPSLPALNTSLNFALMRLLQWAPNVMTQSIRPFTEGPPQGYRGFATRGLASAMRVGRQVFRSAASEPPRAHSVLMMLNPVDPAVNNAMSRDLLGRWQRRGGQTSLYLFDSARKLIHDIIDPEQPQQQIDYVYPILLEQITSM
jgi:alpha-beta hydrolase superfamily lysophospholipase